MFMEDEVEPQGESMRESVVYEENRLEKRQKKNIEIGSISEKCVSPSWYLRHTSEGFMLKLFVHIMFIKYINY